MKVIIAGSRSLHDFKLIEKAVAFSGWGDKIKEVVSGCAPGIDSLAIAWATSKKLRVKRMPAEWDKIDGLPPSQIRVNKAGKKYNVRAGYDRNQAMADYVGPKGALIAIWDGESHGTTDMIERAQKVGMKVCVYEI